MHIRIMGLGFRDCCLAAVRAPRDVDVQQQRYARLCHLPPSNRFKNKYFTEMCSGSEEGTYVRLIDLCITQL